MNTARSLGTRATLLVLAALAALATADAAKARVDCGWTWYENAPYACAGDASAALGAVRSPNATVESCAAACEARAACGSFRARPHSCVLSACVPANPGSRRGRWNFGVMGACAPEGDSSAPSASPSQSPSQSLSPSQSPTRAPSRAFVSPSGVPKRASMNWAAFARVEPSSCETVRSSGRGRTISWGGWAGTLEDCGKECLYDARCVGFYLFDGVCVKTTMLETTDVVGMEDSPKPAAFSRVNSPVAYFSGICSTFESEETCLSHESLCSWNSGKMGWNQVRLVGEGWCGRRKCDSSA